MFETTEITIKLTDEKINLGVLVAEVKAATGAHCDLLEKTKNGNRTLTAITTVALTEAQLRTFVQNHVYVPIVFPPPALPRDKKAEWLVAVPTEKINLLAKELGFL